MENTMLHLKSRDPEADTYFLGRSVVKDPEFNKTRKTYGAAELQSSVSVLKI
jgi:hypothetical protein